MRAKLFVAVVAALLAGAVPAVAHEQPAGGANPAAAAQAAQDAAAAKLAVAPADAERWTITTIAGRHGQALRWRTADGTRWSRDSLNLRGLRSESDQQLRVGADGQLQSLVIRGFNPQGDASETYSVDGAGARYKSQVDQGTIASAPANAAYVPFGGTFDYNAWLAERLYAAPGKTLALLPSGRAALEPLTTLEVTGPGGAKKTVQAWAVTGLGLSPFPIWMDGAKLFGAAGFLNFLPEGWEANAAAMSAAQDEALAKRAPALVAAIAKPPGVPVVFRDVTLYDADTRGFRRNMSVLVENGRIAAVGPAKTLKYPKRTRVFEGAGKTLLPGLWDCHQHYGDDSTGPLLLSMGVTSVRDPGNKPEDSVRRKQRIERGELLGPRIINSLLIDGPGPLSAQIAVVVTDEASALAAVDKAKAMGFSGVKLYGSLDPKLVKPIADRAHALGLRVHGHIPRTMRPLEAVRAGYDEITHINWVMMQFMPDSVINQSNGLARFYGPAQYAADVDLKSPEATAYLDELAKRGTAVDVTLSIFEGGYSDDPGQMAAAYKPYADVVPPAVRRGFLSGGFAVTPEVSRDRMRASYAKLAALVTELYRRGIPTLAGTDGGGMELARDIELYHAAGMSVGDALATATIVPAKTFKLDKEIGSIAPGKRAELFLVDGDVSADLSNIRHVRWVMQGDRLMDADRLRAAAGLAGMPK